MPWLSNQPCVVCLAWVGHSAFSDEGVREIAGVERPEVVQALADADQLHRQAQLLGDRERDAALRGAVELCEDDPGDVDGLLEELGLAQAVLPRGRVDDQQRLVRRVGDDELTAAVKDLGVPIDFNLENMNHFIDWERKDPYKVERGEGECAV